MKVTNILELKYLLEKSKAKQTGREPTQEERDYDYDLEMQINILISKESL